MKKAEIIKEVSRLLKEDKPQDAIAFIYKNCIESPKPSKYLVCPRCGVQRMRKDNTKGICGVCQRESLPNSRYRKKETNDDKSIEKN